MFGAAGVFGSGGQHANRGEGAAHAGLGHRHQLVRDRAAAAQLGVEIDDAPALGRRRQRARLALQGLHQAAIRRAEGGDQRQRGGAPIGIVGPSRMSVRDVLQRAAAGMQVEAILAARQEHAFDVVRDHLGRRAVGIAREAAVEIAVVDRRDAAAGHDRGIVRGREHDQPTVEQRRIERAHQLHQRDLALVFVAMVAGDQQHRRAVAVGSDGDRHRDPAIGRLVRGMRHLQVAVPQPGLVEIDGGGDAGHAAARARAHSSHGKRA